MNNGELKLETYNIHSGRTDEEIIIKMNEINKKASDNGVEKIWIFLDEINTCKSMGLFSEIFSKRSFDGNKLKDNIVLIGACNPYRLLAKDKPEVGFELDEEEEERKLVYLVNPLPFSLLNYVYYFKNINKEYEKEYIKSIFSNSNLLENNKNIKDLVIDLVYFSHNYIRDKSDISSVSLREINRFISIIEFFNEYYRNKNKIKEEYTEEKIIINCIILSIYICYYIRLFNDKLKSTFETEINKILNGKNNSLNLERIKFLDIPNEEMNFIIDNVDNIDNETGIGKNIILKKNIFLIFTAINIRIPIIICGKPGCSKSLSFELLSNSMKGKYSNSTFFRNYPSIIRSFFQGSITTSTKSVINIFKNAKQKLDFFKEKLELEELPISLVFFDELGLAEKSKENPLTILHSELEYDLNEKKENKLAFVGISNYSLDAAKMNRAIFLCATELANKLDYSREAMESIVKSINENLFLDYGPLFEILSKTYYYFKQKLKDNKKYYDKLGSRDFYHLIKNSAIKINSIYNISKQKNKDINDIVIIACIKRAIERNFDGFEFEHNEISKYNAKDSVMLFKEIYNELINSESLNYNISKSELKYDVIERIRDNIHAQAFYGVVSAILDEVISLSSNCDKIADLSADITEVIKEYSKVDWTSNTDIHKKISHALDDLLYNYRDNNDWNLDFDTMDKIIDNVKTIALRRF